MPDVVWGMARARAVGGAEHLAILAPNSALASLGKVRKATSPSLSACDYFT